MHFSLSGLLTEFQHIRHETREAVLATLISCKGSTYCKPGARALITRNNDILGILGGNEMHKRLLSHAREIFHSKQFNIIDITVEPEANDPLNLEMEPGSSLQIMLEYLSHETAFTPLDLLTEAINQHKENILITILESDYEDLSEGASYLLTNNGNNEKFSLAMNTVAQDILAAGKSAIETYLLSDGTFTAFYDIIRAPIHLLIIGTGPDATPMLRLAKLMGWEVTIADCRKTFCEEGHITGADRIITSDPEDLFENIPANSIDAALIMSHRIDLDERYLKSLCTTQIEYIGLMGPTARRSKLLEILPDKAQSLQHRIYGPVGLNIGATNPEQIALAVIAEIQAVANKRKEKLASNTSVSSGNKQMAQVDELYAVILAAGGSTRFGGIKQLLELAGKSLIRRAIETAKALLDDRVVTVIGLKANKIEREIANYGTNIVVNNNWENGLSSSLKKGIATLPEYCKGALIIFCDQPLITTAHFQGLIDLWLKDSSKIIASDYAGTLGVPAIFPREYFSEINQLKGDRGAKAVINNHLKSTVKAPLAEAEVDIDTQEDMINVLNRKLS